MAMVENDVKYSLYCEVGDSTETLRSSIQSLADELSKNYIWHKEPFHIRQEDIASLQVTGVGCFSGTTDVGENICDEWFVIFLLFEISKAFKMMVIQVSDVDGDFLLIEAADQLPRWLKPETSQNRVFISNGSLHVIPLPSSPADIAIFPVNMPSIEQAYKLVFGDYKTPASHAIQNQILSKINEYPQKIEADFHNAHCYIPVELAFALSKRPDLISPIVEVSAEQFPLEPNSGQSKCMISHIEVVCMIRFTRHLYAQLLTMPLPKEKRKSNTAIGMKVSQKAADLGGKVRYGFELLCARSKASVQVSTKPTGEKWDCYIKKLNETGYFRQELEGSKLYRELLEQAEKDFCSGIEQGRNTRLERAGELAVQLAEESASSWQEIEVASQNIRKEDSDDWMQMTADELDAMMLQAWGSSRHPDQTTHNSNLTNVVKNMKSFVDNVASFEGAEIPSTETPSKTSHNDNSGIDFNPDQFMYAFDSIMKIPSERGLPTEDSESDLELSDDDDDGVTSSCREDLLRNGLGTSEDERYAQAMHDELKGTSVRRSFADKSTNINNANNNAASNDQLTDEDDELDVDVNLVKNFLESFASQDGLTGPVSNLLNSMGLNLPPNQQDDCVDE